MLCGCEHRLDWNVVGITLEQLFLNKFMQVQ